MADSIFSALHDLTCPYIPNSTPFPPESPVYTPKDEDNWLIAKLNVQITDLGYSQIVEHLAKVIELSPSKVNHQ